MTIVHKLKLYAEDGSITKKAVRPNPLPLIYKSDQYRTTFAFHSMLKNLLVWDRISGGPRVSRVHFLDFLAFLPMHFSWQVVHEQYEELIFSQPVLAFQQRVANQVSPPLFTHTCHALQPDADKYLRKK